MIVKMSKDVEYIVRELNLANCRVRVLCTTIDIVQSYYVMGMYSAASLVDGFLTSYTAN